MVVEVGGHVRHGFTRVRHHHLCNVGSVRKVYLALNHQHLRAAVYGVLGKRMPVHFEPDNAEERIARFYFVASIGNARHFLFRIAYNGALHSLK